MFDVAALIVKEVCEDILRWNVIIYSFQLFFFFRVSISVHASLRESIEHAAYCVIS